MNANVREWIEKAEGDHFSAMREFRARNHPNYDSACFHAQQCVEKYLKAALQRQNVQVRKIHDLPPLLNECLPGFPLWEALRPDMKLLAQYSVVFRYPGQCATKEQAREALAAMGRCRGAIREGMGVESEGAGRGRKIR